MDNNGSSDDHWVSAKRQQLEAAYARLCAEQDAGNKVCTAVRKKQASKSRDGLRATYRYYDKDMANVQSAVKSEVRQLELDEICWIICHSNKCVMVVRCKVPGLLAISTPLCTDVFCLPCDVLPFSVPGISPHVAALFMDELAMWAAQQGLEVSQRDAFDTSRPAYACLPFYTLSMDGTGFLAHTEPGDMYMGVRVPLSFH